MKKSLLVVVITTLLTGCAGNLDTIGTSEQVVPELKSGKARPVYIQKTGPEIIEAVDVYGAAFDLKNATSVNLPRTDVCKAAKVVLGNILGVGFACSADAQVSMYATNSTPIELLKGFLTAIEVAGLDYAVRTNFVKIHGQGTSADVQRGPTPANIPSAPVRDVASMFVLKDADPALVENMKIERSYAGQREIRLFKYLQTSSEGDQLSLDAKMNISFFEASGFVYGIGDPEDINAFHAILSQSTTITIPVSVSSAETIDTETLADAYPLLTFSKNNAKGVLFVNGNRWDVLDAIGSIRSVLGRSGDIEITAYFIGIDDNYTDTFGVTATATAQSGNIVIRAGGFGSQNSLLIDIAKAEKRGKGNVYLSPSLTVSDGETGSFTSGDVVPTITAITEDGRQSIEYRQSGITFSTKPIVLPNGAIKLELSLLVSTVNGTGAGGSPVFQDRSINTSAILNSGDVIALTGLKMSSKQINDERNFLIFPSKTKAKRNQEFSLIITARIK